MPIRLWLSYSKLFKSITRMTQMPLFTHLDSFQPISPPATVQNHLFWMHGQPATPCRASTHFSFYSQSLWSTPWGPSGPAPSTISWATRNSVNSPSCSPYCACLHGDPIYNNGMHQIFTYCAKYFVFMLSSYSEYYITLHFTEGTNCEKVSHLHSKVYIVKWKIQRLNLGQSD